MIEESVDVQKMILSELREIKGEVRLIPKLQAQIDSALGATQQLEMAMRESTAALQMTATAHAKLLDEVRLQQHQLTAAMMGISNDVQSLIPRVRDLEKQVAASFQQQQALARDVREMGERETVPALTKHLDDYQAVKQRVDKLTETFNLFVDQVKVLIEYLPWLRVLKYFLVTAGGLVVVLVVRALIKMVMDYGVVP